MKLKQDVTHGTWDYPFQVHHTQLTNGLDLYPHVHDELEITCITQGGGIFSINNHSYHVKKGDLLIIPPDSIHLARPAEYTPASFDSIVFSPYCFCISENNRIYSKYIAPILNRHLFFPEHLDRSEAWHEEVWELAMEIRQNSLLTDGELLCQSSLFKLWYLLFQHCLTGNSNFDMRSLRLKDSIDYMHAHFSEYITITDLASIANMSEGHFSRTFKEYMKVSPLDYLIQIRINESAKLLQKSDLLIGEIALSCGFNDLSYFGKCFKKEKNCTPREYRRS